MVRCICALTRFDRLGVALITRQPYGTVSRVLSELANEGYIETTGERETYDKWEVRKNPDFYYDGVEAGMNGKPRKRKKLIWPYGKKGGSYRFTKCAVLWKTTKWAEFMVRWRCTI